MTESHWELGHILSLGTATGRWHLPKPGKTGVALCGKFAHATSAETFPPRWGSPADWEAAPMCRTCQHIRRGK